MAGNLFHETQQEVHPGAGRVNCNIAIVARHAGCVIAGCFCSVSVSMYMLSQEWNRGKYSSPGFGQGTFVVFTVFFEAGRELYENRSICTR